MRNSITRGPWKYLGKGICAIDLAGAEALFPTSKYRELFAYVKAQDIPFTIHAGEAGPASNVSFAISQNGGRIGHGIHAVEDDAVVDALVQNNILCEVSVTSNVYSRCVPSITEHPIRRMWDKGVMININTDDPGLMGIDLKHEYDVIAGMFGFTERDFILSNLYAARASFCEGKEDIIAALTKALHECA